MMAEETDRSLMGFYLLKDDCDQAEEKRSCIYPVNAYENHPVFTQHATVSSTEC